jgi:acyl-[acyl-carrier-protein]-phospholipid O-acyltransferase/long-chain-fatty-acid--[acyl-carrier-protein] ligase
VSQIGEATAFFQDMANEISKPTTSGYAALLRNRGFQGFLWTQFLGAFNDNVYKMIVSVGAVELAANQVLGARYLALAGAVFVVPFLLFAGYAGQIADRFSKTRVLQATKALEIGIMLAGMAALHARSVNLLLGVLFLLAVQANMFSPAKYGILPELLSEAQISRGNGLLEFSTFAAIILGTSGGTFLFARWKDEPLLMGAMLLGVALVGSAASIFITSVPAANTSARFRWNPFHEVWLGMKRMAAHRPLWLTVAGISYFWFIGALFQLTVILLGKETLHLPEMQTGLLITTLAVGIGVGSLAAGWLSGNHIEVGLVPCGAVALGASALLLAGAHSFGAAALWLAAAGFAGGLYIVPLNAFLQENAAPGEKGRLQAANSFSNAIGIVLAAGLLYLLHDIFHKSPSWIVGAVGLMSLATTAFIAWTVPAPAMRFLIWAASRVLFRVRIVGAENIPNNGSALIVSNHVSYADAVLIGSITPRLIRFLMWEPIYQNRWVNPICRLFQAIPLPKHSPKESLRALCTAQAELEAGQLVCIFPEGELAGTPYVQTFQRGVELIARGLADVPLIPVYLDGLWGHPLSRASDSAIGGLRRWFRHDVTVCIGEPITGSVRAEDLQQRVIELGSQAAEYRKGRKSTLRYHIIRSARKHWSAAAMADSSGRRLTFGQTFTGALLLGRWIARNCGDSRCVGILLPASVGGAIANLGVTLAGKAAVNLNFTAGPESMQHAITQCEIETVISSRVFLEKANLREPRGVVYVEDLFSRFTWFEKAIAAAEARWRPIRALAGKTAPDDLAAIIFSSGSTGTPKGVMLSHWNVLSNVNATAQVYQVDSTDCMLGVLPLFHSFGYSYTFWFPLLRGFRTVFHANPMDAKTIGELAADHHATLLLSTPTFCMNYLNRCAKDQFHALRYLLVGAEKLRPALVNAFQEKFGITPLEGYGCTEMAPAVAVNGSPTADGVYRSGSVGRPLPNVATRIVDPDTFRPLPAGDTGLLLVKSPSQMLGYLNEPQRAAEACRDGFYVTGDIGRLDADGFLYIVDRLSRFSKIAGEMVPHLKVEEALSTLLGSGRCVVTAIPDERRGERLAVLYTGEESTPSQMIEHLEAWGLPALWIPKKNQFHCVDQIPVLGTGKVDLVSARAIAMKYNKQDQPRLGLCGADSQSAASALLPTPVDHLSPQSRTAAAACDPA